MGKVAQNSLQSNINYYANLGRCGGCQSRAGVQEFCSWITHPQAPQL